MENNTDLKQPGCPKQDTSIDEAIDQQTSHSSLRKTVLIAAAIGAVTIAVLLTIMFGSSLGTDTSDYQGGLSGSTLADAVTGIPGPAGLMIEAGVEPFTLEVSQTEPPHDLLHLKLDSCIGRVDQGFDALKAGQLGMNNELPAIGEGVRAIRHAIVDLRVGNEVLSQRITEIQTKLETITKDVRGLKTPKKRITAKKRKPVIKIPPFQVDAIDLWNDVTYVAVSHNGRAAFLKEGEQQSGWLVTQIDRLKGEVGFRGPVGQIHSAIVRR